VCALPSSLVYFSPGAITLIICAYTGVFEPKDDSGSSSSSSSSSSVAATMAPTPSPIVAVRRQLLGGDADRRVASALARGLMALAAAHGFGR
jgi:hypothetical protein